MKTLSFIILLTCLSNLFSQSFSDASIKYWYYRDRLKYFVYPGNEKGNSVICTYRNPIVERTDEYVQSTIHTIKFGQTYKSMGYYIGMLATEYTLLKKNHQFEDANQTLMELNLALDALIRMDNCESDMPWNENLDNFDGFFTRCDVPPILSQAMINHLNENVRTGTISDYENLINQGYKGFPFEIKEEHVNCASMYESPLNKLYQLREIVDLTYNSTFLSNYNSHNETYWNYWKTGNYTSNDEIVGILMGLALVSKYVDVPSVQLKSNNIALKMLEFANGSGIPYQMHYPDGTAINSDNGGNSAGLFYGMN